MSLNQASDGGIPYISKAPADSGHMIKRSTMLGVQATASTFCSYQLHRVSSSIHPQQVYCRLAKVILALRKCP
jgi:hypothetical protein